jgi:hypothetical protein
LGVKDDETKLECLKADIRDNENVESFLVKKSDEEFMYRLIYNGDKTRIIGVIRIIVSQPEEIVLKYYFTMSISREQVQGYLNETETTLLQIVKTTVINPCLD